MKLYSSPFIIVCWIAASVYAGIDVNINIGKAEGNVGKAEGNVEKEKVEHELVTGVLPPVFTPFNDDFSINYSVIPGYVEYLDKKNIKGFLVNGNSGEGMSMTVEERKKVTEAWVAAAKPYGMHVMVQVGGAPLPDVIEVTKHAQEAGADSLLTLPELFYKPTTVEQLVEYVGLVAAAAPHLPVIYYHFPSNTNIGISMPAFLTAAAKKISNFRGIQLASNDLNEAQAVLKNLPHGYKAYSGAANTPLAAAAEIGFDSTIGGPYSFVPELAADLLEAVACGNVSQARALQHKLTQYYDLLTVEGSMVPGMKLAMERVTGIKVGPARPPQPTLTPEQRERIEAGLKELGATC